MSKFPFPTAMGKDSFAFLLFSSFGCLMGTILSYCALFERSAGSASVAPLIWTSPCVAKNPCVTASGNFYHQHGCRFSSVKVSFPLFFKICPYSALREIFLPFYLTKKTPNKQNPPKNIRMGFSVLFSS